MPLHHNMIRRTGMWQRSAERGHPRKRLALEPFEERAPGGRDIREVPGNARRIERGHRVTAPRNGQQGALPRQTRSGLRGGAAEFDVVVVDRGGGIVARAKA